MKIFLAFGFFLGFFIFSSTFVFAEGQTLQTGDVVIFNVGGEPDLNRRLKISDDGSIELPMIGNVTVENFSLQQAKDIIIARYADGYLVDPKITLKYAEQRPFYIVGEVRFPGSFSYKDGMSIADAVEKAGGFTFRADQKDIMLLRAQSGNKDIYKQVPVETILEPGDILLVKERFF